jgi:hypothetical protein
MYSTVDVDQRDDVTSFTFDLKRPRAVSELNRDEVPLYAIHGDWWHRGRTSASPASASLIVGAPVTVASLISSYLARAFLPFTFAAFWIGCIEASIHLSKYLRQNGLGKGFGCELTKFMVAVLGHALILFISVVRGWEADTPTIVCAIWSTGCYALGFGAMLIVEQWWYSITPSQLLFFIATLHAIGLLIMML